MNLFTRWVLVLLAVILDPTEQGVFGSDKEYSMVIEAGSSEIKLMVGVFEKRSDKRRYLRQEELYETFKPGVSDFVDNPQGFQELIDQVLCRAETFIEHSKWDDTPVTFRGTECFRQLEEDKRVALLQEVNNALDHHKFLRKEYSVSILSDSEEGVYGWIAANLFADRYYGTPDDMVTTLGLNDASAHISFPLTHAFFRQFPLEIRWANIAGAKVNFFTRKYPTLGLDTATMAILALENTPGATAYYSSCITALNDDARYKAQPQIPIYGLRGGYGTAVNIEYCTNSVKTYVRSVTTRDFGPALNYRIYALDDFYFILKDGGLIEESSDGVIAIDRIKAMSDKVCGAPGPHKKPFLCLHLIYIYTLLTEAYKFPSSTEITVVNEVNGNHINWALGMAFYSLELGT